MLQGRRDATSGSHVSVWTRSAGIPKFPVLGHDIRVDVAVVGGGIAGLSVAYEAARRGMSVAVVDDGAVGSGETGRTTAHLASAVDDHYHVIESIHGEQAARVVAASHSAAIDRIEAIAAEEGIACGFERVDGWLFARPGEDPGILDMEYEAASRAGLEVHRGARAPIPGFDTGPALRFPRQGQMHPLRYLTGLAEAALRRGVTLYTGHATEIEGGRDAGVLLQTGKRIKAGSVVVATNVPVNDRLSMHTKLEPQRTYVTAFKVPAGSLPRALLWDTDDPYHYIRVVADAEDDPDSELLLVGGEDHPVGQADDFDRRYASLEAWTRLRYPMAGETYAAWSGQIVETLDGLAYIGRNPGDHDNVYIVTGDSGNGLTHGAISGLILPDLIRGKPHPWADAYRPGRLPAKAAGELGRHGLRMAARYADWVKAGTAAGERDLEPGEGAVVRHGLRPVAVYRDLDGQFHRMSAICPHLKCVVAWNASEQTWDCPCHGSRFNRRGHVINGPANRDLAHLYVHEEHPAGSA
jgi:glycine/D-amino acid oxidase-like deaminating enzyme/nitrite reductase/ring-hydroxylating ferredoxin subunit